MLKLPSRFLVSAIGVAVLLSACGGGGTTPDTIAPVVTISDSVSAATATGDVTFTFTFSEAVSGFTADDVTVSGGTKGAFNMASNGLSATLVVSPTANASGTVSAEVAAGKFSDAAGNMNTTVMSASQAFNTVLPYLSFDESTPSATALGQYGGSVPTFDAAPAGAGGNALKIVKPTGSDVWAGAYFTVPRVPFTATQKTITAKVYSSVANAVIKLKVEVVGGGNVEVSGTPVASANTWTTVTWDFSGIDLTAQYTVLAVTPDATRATDGAIYYLDDIQIVNTPAAPAPVSFSRVSFDEATAPKLTDFGTNTTPPEIATDPVDNTNKVLKVYKAPGSEQWAGVTVSTGASDSIATIPFSATAKSMTLRVYSPAAGVRIRLKVENAGDNTITCETDALTTTANAWETLTFNFANPGANPPVGGGPTAALDLTKTYNKASVFADFGLGKDGGTLPASRTYYFDNLTFTAP